MATDGTRARRFLRAGRRPSTLLLLLALAYPFVLPRLSDHPWPRVLPAAVSLYLFGVFAWSLFRGPPIIERFARLVEDDLPDFTLPYCRRLTVLWCGFFVTNAAIVLAVAQLARPAWWSVYTGVVAYALVGLLLLGETCFRKWWFRYYGSGPFDRVFARLFPAERSINGRRSLAYVAERARGVTHAGNSPTLRCGHDRHSRSG